MHRKTTFDLVCSYIFARNNLNFWPYTFLPGLYLSKPGGTIGFIGQPNPLFFAGLNEINKSNFGIIETGNFENICQWIRNNVHSFEIFEEANP
jgi:hypothetical protein